MKNIFAALIIVALTSCHHMEFISTGGKPVHMHHVSKHAQRAVRLYFSPDEIPAGAKRVGVITSSINKEGKSLIKAKAYAAAAGCNAVVLIQGKEQSGGGALANAALGGRYFTGKWRYYALKVPVDTTDSE